MNTKTICRLVALGMVILAGSLALADDDPVEIEQQVSWKELPEAVQATILEQAGDREILELVLVTLEDQVLYEAEWMEEKLEVEIQVAVDGKLLGRETEEPDADDEDQGEED